MCNKHTRIIHTCFEEGSEVFFNYVHIVKKTNTRGSPGIRKSVSTPGPQTPSPETSSVTSFWYVLPETLHRWENTCIHSLRWIWTISSMNDYKEI